MLLYICKFLYKEPCKQELCPGDADEEETGSIVQQQDARASLVPSCTRLIILNYII